MRLNLAKTRKRQQYLKKLRKRQLSIMLGLAEGSVTNLKTDLKTEGDGKVYNISFDYGEWFTL